MVESYYIPYPFRVGVYGISTLIPKLSKSFYILLNFFYLCSVLRSVNTIISDPSYTNFKVHKVSYSNINWSALLLWSRWKATNKNSLSSSYATLHIIILSLLHLSITFTIRYPFFPNTKIPLPKFSLLSSLLA